jgi:hypothetical protein
MSKGVLPPLAPPKIGGELQSLAFADSGGEQRGQESPLLDKEGVGVVALIMRSQGETFLRASTIGLNLKLLEKN